MEAERDESVGDRAAASPMMQPIDLTTSNSDDEDDDVDDEAWLQIPGATQDEMSDSDDSLTEIHVASEIQHSEDQSSHLDSKTLFHRNKVADRYLAALDRYGKEGLAVAIIEEEKQGTATQLRSMTGSADAVQTIRQEIAIFLYSMDTSLIKALIQGQLPRLAEVESGPVHEALEKLNKPKYVQLGTYINCICDATGLSPTPTQWNRVCLQMSKYVASGHEDDDLAERIDQRVHPKREWPKELAHKGLRRYTEWRSWTMKGSSSPDRSHRRMVSYFIDQLQVRMQGQVANVPLNIPVVEVGFSNNPLRRLRQHRHHESSNYLMNLAEAVFAVEYPSAFRLQQRIVVACFRPIQTWLSEIIITQLIQGYVEGGGGFSHEPAGQSNTSSNLKLPSELWARFEYETSADGRIVKEILANKERIEARKRVAQELQARLKTCQENIVAVGLDMASTLRQMKKDVSNM